MLVPREHQRGWRREWDGEIDAAAARGLPTGRLAVGAFADAVTVRRLAAARAQHERRGRAMPGKPNDGMVDGVKGGWREVRRAMRSLLRAPGFTAASVVTLAVGLGAAAAIFTLVHAVLLRPLPYPAAKRVVRVHHTMRQSDGASPVARFAYALFEAEARSFEAIGGYWNPSRYTLSGDDMAERVEGVRATAGLLDVLGARPVAGRLFSAEDAADPEDYGVVLGHGLWQRRYGGERSIVGRTIEVNGRAREVRGVMAAGVDLPQSKVDLWIPYAVPAGTRADDSFRISILARLRPDIDLTAADNELRSLTARFPEIGAFYQTYLDEYGLATRARSLREEVVGEVERPLWILLGAVFIVLLVAAANVATLFLVRAEARQQEVAVRTALGAGRSGLIGHFLAESLVIMVAAGTAGLLLAYGALRVFTALAPPTIPRLDEIAIGWSTVAVLAALCVVLALALGLYPFLRFGRGDFTTLRGRATGENRGQAAIGGGLVVAQVALALVLLSGSALLFRTFQALRAVDPGFDPEGVLVTEFSLPAPSYPDAAEVRLFERRLLERVQALPGVRAAALGPSPLGQGGCNGMYVEGRVVPEGQFPPCVPVVFVSPGYFELLGIRNSAGRTFEDRDRSVPVAVVSENVARRLWPDGNALGGGVHPSPRTGPPWYHVMGILDPVRSNGPDQEATEAVYFPIGALDAEGGLNRSATLLVSTTPDREMDVAPALRRAIAELDPSVPLTVHGSLSDEQARVMSRSSFTLFLLATAAGTALLLGLVGLYGVVAYRVGRRRPEIGLRMALGAPPQQVRALVLRHALRLVAAGTIIGLAASAVLTHSLSSLLFGVEPGDPATLAASAFALVATATMAAWIPARQAAKVDPARALRSD
jgi:predicted permease